MNWRFYRHFLIAYVLFNVVLIVHTVMIGRDASKACGDKERVTFFRKDGIHAVCRSSDGQFNVTEKLGSW